MIVLLLNIIILGQPFLAETLILNKDFFVKIVHFAANLRGPRFTGRNITEEVVVDASEYNCAMASHCDVSESRHSG